MPESPMLPSPITNADARRIAIALRGADRVVVLTHAKPDGDAVGSAIAAVRAINKAHSATRNANTQNSHEAAHGAEAWFFGPLPVWIKKIVRDTPVRCFEQPFAALRLPEGEWGSPDALLITDTAAWTQLEPVHDWVRARHAVTSVIDHHVQGSAEVAALRYVDTSAAAVVQPVCELCMELLGVSSPAKLPADVAEPLYLGLATDTGWFKHSNVTPRVMRLAGDLLEAGANHVGLYGAVEQNDSVGRLKLVSKALASLDMRLAGRLAMMHVSLDDLRTSGAAPGETGGLTDFTHAIAGVAVSAMFVESPSDKPNTGTIQKISMRSKSEPIAVDVSAIAAQLNGGGHVRAAGAKFRGTAEEAKAVVERLVAEGIA